MSEVISVGDKVSRACREAIPDVLEKMFFELLAASPDVCCLPACEPLDTSRVDFEGSLRGCLRIAAAPGLSACLAAAFLAFENHGATASNIEFVLGELANMLCGSALGRL